MKKCSIILISLLATQPVAAVDFSSLFKQVFNYFPSMKASTQTVQNTWSSLTPAQQGVALTATAAATFGIIYASWPIKKEFAYRDADRDAAQKRKNIDTGKTQLSDNHVPKVQSFRYGPFWKGQRFNVWAERSKKIWQPGGPSCPQVMISDETYNPFAVLCYFKEGDSWKKNVPSGWDKTMISEYSIPELDRSFVESKKEPVSPPVKDESGIFTIYDLNKV
jgi:hypothetical protein